MQKGLSKKVVAHLWVYFAFLVQQGTHFLLQKRPGGEKNMTNRIALIGIVVNNEESTEQLNKILHGYKDFIVGRMGIPYRSRGVNLISIVIDAPNDMISALTGKIGMLKGVTAKALYSKVEEE